MMMRVWRQFAGAAAAAFVALALPACAADEARARSPIANAPWTEAVLSVSDIDRTAAFFLDAGNYETRWRGAIDASVISYWGLPAGASGEAMLISSPGSENGFIRLVRLDGVEKEPIRPGARPWDTGGHFSLMLRTDDLEALYKEAIALGWWSESEIIDLDFGTSVLKNVVFKGPDGVNIAVYERVSPPLDAFWPDFKGLSQPFNTMSFVPDFDEAYAFHTDILGFKTFYKGEPYTEDAPTYSNFSIPTGLTTDILLQAGIMTPKEGEVGRLEFISIGLEGEDYAARANPPNLGILAIRYPVEDAAAAKAEVAARGGAIAYDTKRVEIAPYGAVDMFGIKTPVGGLLEFYAIAE